MKIVITETLSKVIEIDDENAYEIVKEKYYNGEIVLTADDYLCTDFDEMEGE